MAIPVDDNMLKRFSRLLCAALCTSLLTANSAVAEVEMVNEPGDRPHPHWWARVIPPAGWQQDEGASLHYDVRAIVPTGGKFDGAPTVMYTKTVLKQIDPKIKTLDAFIQKDQMALRAGATSLAIEKAPALPAAKGAPLPSFLLHPITGEGPWERVAYAEEGNFWLIFTLSAHEKKEYESALPAFEALVKSYRGKMPEAAKPKSSKPKPAKH